MTGTTQSLCDDGEIAQLVDRLGADETGGLQRLQGLLRDYSGDPRLHFLQGSFLAGNRDYDGAAAAMRQAVDIAPDYHLARFQLGFLLLTSGHPYAAQEAWGPLHGLPAGNYIHSFVEGLSHLIRDEFPQAIAAIEEGIGLNDENFPMNADMRLVIDGIHARDTGPQAQDDGSDEPVSAAHMLLQQAAIKATRH